MRVLLAVAVAVIGICLSQANAVPTALRDESASSGEVSLHQAVLANENLVFKVFTSVNEALEKILQALLDGYKSIRTIVLREITLMLKFMKIDFDVEKWLNNLEEALADCGRTRREEMLKGANALFKDALGCVRVNVDKVDEIRERGLQALEILSKAGPYFREQYETCQNGGQKPTEPTTEKPAEPGTNKPPQTDTDKPAGPDTEKPAEPGTGTAVAEGTGTRSMTCLATATGKTLVYLKPVPGHLYTLIKMIFNVSVNDKQEVVKCFKEKWPTHLQFFQTTMRSYAICVAFS